MRSLIYPEPNNYTLNFGLGGFNYRSVANSSRKEGKLLLIHENFSGIGKTLIEYQAENTIDTHSNIMSTESYN